jgi:deoxyribodipyrimidine photo-lyase
MTGVIHPDGAYVRRYVPELAEVPAPFVHAPWKMGAALAGECCFRLGRDYPRPIVEHARERAIALSLYGSARGKKKSDARQRSDPQH